MLSGTQRAHLSLKTLSRAAFASALPPVVPARSIRPFSSSWTALEVVKVPQMAESISEGTLKQWLKKKGDHVEADEEVATIETDKIDVSVNAPQAGTITELFASEEDTVTVGQDLFNIEEGAAPAKSEESSSADSSKKEDEAPKKEDESSKKPQKEEKSSRRKETQESNLESKESTPSRSEATHTKSEDLKQPTPSSSATSKSASKPATDKAEPKSTSSGQGNRTERRVKMNSMRKRISERLKQSQNTAAALTTFNEVDMSALMALRTQYKDKILKDQGVKLGFMSAFAKASCLALKEFPAANAKIEGPGTGEQICYHDYVDLSVAVATPKGLVTPIVRNAESMNLIEIERAIAALGKKARDGKLTLEDMTGGTFTISNGGVFGSLFGTPIINLPQSAVLGMHAIKDRAWVVNGKIEIRPIMTIALTYDHRLLDGREAVSTLVRIKEYLENPASMLLAA